MNSANLAIVAVPSILGIVGGLASALFLRWLRRDEIRLEMEEKEEQINATREQIKKTQLEMEDLRGKVQAAVSYQDDAASLILYDARKGFSGFDFAVVHFNEAAGKVTLIDDDVEDGVLNLERSNVEGFLRTEFKSYLKEGVELIPAGTAGARRRVRAELEARVLGAEHTMLLSIKNPASAQGEHLAEWRERLVSDVWTPIDAYFVFPADTPCKFRIDNRSVSHAPSSMQIRRLVLTERKS